MDPEICRDPREQRYFLRRVQHPFAYASHLNKLNLGCGYCVYDGFTNVDLVDIEGVEKVDLFQFPWPWDDNTFHYVLAADFLEHVSDDAILGVIHEIGRVLKDGGVLEVICPHPRTHGTFMQVPGHNRLIGPWTFRIFSEKYHTYSGEHNQAKAGFHLEIARCRNRRGFRIPNTSISDYHTRKYLRMEIGKIKTIHMYIEKRAR